MASKIVVVTGASGYIGCHIVSNLLSRGRHVRATVRDSSDPERVAHLEALEIGRGGSLELVEMDLFDIDSVNNAIEGAEEVIHTAAAVMIMSSNPQLKIVDPSVIGTQNIVAAIDNSDSVKCLIHTSSTAAIRPTKWKNGSTLTSETWADDATLENNPYGLAKVSSERIVRSWHSQKSVDSRQRLVTIHPCMVFGPPMSTRHLRGSLALMMTVLRREMPVVLPMQINVVDVRDVAEAHVRALTEGEDAGRYLVTSGDISMRDMAKLLKSQYPDMDLPSFELPYSLALIAALFHPKISVSWARSHLKKKIYWDSSPAKKDLGMNWILPPDSILAAADKVIENDWV